MIMFYTDRPATAYWRPYILRPHESAQIRRDKMLENDLARQVAQLLPRENYDEEAHVERVENSIESFAIRDWSHAPFGAACMRGLRA